jgi:transposase
VFTVPEEFVLNLVKKYKSKACGRILASKVSDGAKELITKDKIQELHNILEKSTDVKDIIKNMP